jgi:ribonuclease BN (tRNA processing enzyme)
MQLTFWGVRGSSPQSGAAYHYYGGHTACTSLRIGKELIVFDAGSGLLNLSQSLEQEKDLPEDIYFFITHGHLDHVLGLSGFSWLWKTDIPFKIHFISAYTVKGQSLASILQNLIQPPYFPLALKDSKVSLSYHDMKEAWQGDGWQIQAFALNHPGGSSGYRFDCPDYSLAYVTDTSIIESPDFYQWLEEIDLLIHDSMFNDQEVELYPSWGHSSVQQVTNLAKIVKAKNLILYHHHPYHNDKDIDKLQKQAQLTFPSAIMAREGAIYLLSRESAMNGLQLIATLNTPDYFL